MPVDGCDGRNEASAFKEKCLVLDDYLDIRQQSLKLASGYYFGSTKEGQPNGLGIIDRQQKMTERGSFYVGIYLQGFHVVSVLARETRWIRPRDL